MGTQMNRWAYEKMIAEDIAALPASMPEPERMHVVAVLRDSVTRIYGEARCGAISGNSLYTCNRSAGHEGDHMEGLAVWSSESEGA